MTPLNEVLQLARQPRVRQPHAQVRGPGRAARAGSSPPSPSAPRRPTTSGARAAYRPGARRQGLPAPPAGSRDSARAPGAVPCGAAGGAPAVQPLHQSQGRQRQPEERDGGELGGDGDAGGKPEERAPPIPRPVASHCCMAYSASSRSRRRRRRASPAPRGRGSAARWPGAPPPAARPPATAAGAAPTARSSHSSSTRNGSVAGAREHEVQLVVIRRRRGCPCPPGCHPAAACRRSARRRDRGRQRRNSTRASGGCSVSYS